MTDGTKIAERSEIRKRLEGAYILCGLGDVVPPDWQVVIDAFIRSAQAQGYLARLASGRHDMLLEMERRQVDLKAELSRSEERERVLQAKLLLWESEGISAIIGADKMAAVCDDWVKRGLIDARSAFADARLAYCDPYTFKWPAMKAEFAALSTPAPEQPKENL